MSTNTRSNFLKDQVVNIPTTHLQYGAIPYRDNIKVGLEILLITGRETARWIIPKGWPVNGLQPDEFAAREAYEEAGVRGTVGSKSIGSYVYSKVLDDKTSEVRYEVIVFPLRVRRQEKVWPEFSATENPMVFAG